MPFKHNVTRRHRIPGARYRVTNWPSYEAGLRQRGDLTFWVDEAALAGGKHRAGTRRAVSRATRSSR